MDDILLRRWIISYLRKKLKYPKVIRWIMRDDNLPLLFLSSVISPCRIFWTPPFLYCRTTSRNDGRVDDALENNTGKINLEKKKERNIFIFVLWSEWEKAVAASVYPSSLWRAVKIKNNNNNNKPVAIFSPFSYYYVMNRWNLKQTKKKEGMRRRSINHGRHAKGEYNR